MAVFAGQLTLSATPQRLSNVYGGASLTDRVNAAQDLPCLMVLLQATGADAYLGQDNTVSSSVYGTKVASASTGAERLGPFWGGAVKLSDLWVVGSGATLHVTAVTF